MVSIKVTVMTITLITVCVLATKTTASYPGCCNNYMRGKIPFAIIKGYSVQSDTEMCHINAIIFLTKKGKACANPAWDWVMDYIDRLRSKARKFHQKSLSQI
ncbi:C-C motif chemokine 20a.3 [Melanotaenia boesemani]|uniref:C-C motif chemokine 20a.3 n=1 Tax=Melanotaenia boesemani TaxID=1250792 RepID=UPI001C04224C|nr:C-C motif chemokine 20a.3 [Melanotaenia boesemani]